MVRHAIIVQRLSHAVGEGRFLWALCKNCGHAVKLDPRNLIALQGDLTLRELQKSCRCRRCKRRQAAIVINDAAGWPARD